MAWAKAKTAIVVAVGLLAAAGTTTVVVQHIERTSSGDTSWTDDPKYWELDFNDSAATFRRIDQLRPVLVLRPTKFAKGYGMMGSGEKIVAKNQPMIQVLRMAYDPGFNHRLVLPQNLSRRGLDVMLTLPFDEHPLEKLQEKLRSAYGLTAHCETNEENVLLMKQISPNAPGLIPTATPSANPSVTMNTTRGTLTIKNWTLETFSLQFEQVLKMPVLNRTEGDDHYDCNITWQPRAGETMEDAFKRVVADQLGLGFETDRAPIARLVVENVK